MKTMKTMVYVSGVIAFYLLAVMTTIQIQKDVGRGERVIVAATK